MHNLLQGRLFCCPAQHHTTATVGAPVCMASSKLQPAASSQEPTVVAPPLPQALLVTNPNNPLGRLLQSCTCVLIAVCNRVSTYVGAAGHQPQQPARHDLQR